MRSDLRRPTTKSLALWHSTAARAPVFNTPCHIRAAGLGNFFVTPQLRHPGVAVRTLACDAEGVAIDLAQNCLPQILYEDEQMVIA